MSDRRELGRLFAFVRPYRRAFAVAFALLAASFAIELVGPWLLRAAIDGPVTAAVRGTPHDGVGLAAFALAYVGIVIGGALLGYTFAVVTANAGKRAITDLRCALYAHLVRLDARWHDRNATGKVVTRVTTDVENLDQLVTTGALQALFDLTKLAGLVAALAWFVPALFWFALAALPLAGLIGWVFKARARRSYGAVRTHLAQQNGWTAELVGGIRTIRAYGREEFVDARFDALNDATRVAWDDTIRCYAAFFAAVDAALRLAQTGVLWIGGTAVAAGTATAGGLVQGWMYFNKLTVPIRNLGERYNVLQSALASAERLRAILDTPLGPSDGPTPVESGRGPARIELAGVTFGYAADRPVLRDVDLVATPGTVTAIVGPTGAGKTTLLALLSRVHDVDGGAILLDGIDVRALSIASLRRRVAVVPQEPMLFTGSVLDNVRLFDTSVDESTVRRVLTEIGMLERLEARGGLEAPLGERGTTLSRGERQLLAIARALLAEPDVLVLDEPTANVDSATEQLVQTALHAARRNRTVLVVAHRLATVRDADQIVVLDGGRVVERGTHAELLQRDGRYAAMVHAVGRSA